VKEKILIISILILVLVKCSAIKNLNNHHINSNLSSQDSTSVKPVELSINPQEKEELFRLKRLYNESLKLLENSEINLAESTLVAALDIILIRGDDENRIITADYKEIETLITNKYKKLIQRNQIFNEGTPPEAIRYELDKLTLDDTREEDVEKNGSALSSFPLTVNRKVSNVIKFFQTRGNKTFTKWLERSTLYKDMMIEIFRDEGIPEDLIYLAMIESGFNPRAISSRYAVGMWQFMSSTGKMYDLRRNELVDERKDPYKSTVAAAKHLKDLYNKYGDWYLAVACYNCSPSKIERAMRRHKTRDFWKLRTIPRETRNHIPTLIGAILLSKHPEKYGFKNIAYMSSVEMDLVRLDTSLDLLVAAECMNTDYLTLKQLNPELRSWLTPTFKNGYFLKIPKGKKDIFTENLSKLPKDKLIKSFPHVIRKGETVSSIANKYRVKAAEIISLNKIRNPRRLRIGQLLKIPAHKVENPVKRFTRKVEVPGKKRIIYTVKPGDTLGEIAEVYGVRARDIRYWNDLSYRAFIYPKQKLDIWVLPTRDYGNRSQHIEEKPNGNNTNSSNNDGMRYQVKSGDTITRIARHFSIEESDIVKWNNLSNKDIIYPGQILIIYLQNKNNIIANNSEELNNNSQKYLVRQGDSLWKISRDFGVSIDELKRINNIRSARFIRSGDKLIIPQH